MKKKLISLVMTLVIIITILPFETLATETVGSETPPTEGGGSTNASGSTEGGEDGTSPSLPDSDSLLTVNAFSVNHPTHLTTGEVTVTKYINPASGKLSYKKVSATPKGSVQVSGWSVSDNGILSFDLSSGKTGDTIEFIIEVASEKFAADMLTVLVKLNYERLMITSSTTMVYGDTMTLSCQGMEGNGAVIYTVVNGTGSATVSGNKLTATRVGTVTVSAVQVLDGIQAAKSSEAVTITITKATPTGSPKSTKLEHAGMTLADANLTLGNFSVEGAVEWVLPENTVAVANTAYEWEFIPKDTDNYSSFRGTITPYIVNDKTFAVGEGTTVENLDGSFTTISFGEDSSSYKLTEYPDGSVTMVHTKMDGTVTTTEKKADGTRTETIEKKDGSKQITATDKSGITHTSFTDRYGYASAQVYIPSYITTSAARNGSVIELPIPELPCTDDRSDAPVITFTLHTTDPVRVSIPVNSPTSGTVAITVAKNGQESIVKTSTIGYDSVEVPLSGSATIKIADLSKRFTDVDRRHWYKDAVDFATSRGLFNGVTAFKFDAHGHMSRAMLVQVLHNLEGNPYYGYGDYYGYAKYLSDVEGKWYEASAAWAIANGHIGGYEDGTFRGELDITREQLAVILYRYAGYPSVKHYVNTSLTDYLDYKNISPYAYEAMYWALCSGVLYTAGGDKLSPQQSVTRAEVAQTFKNLVEFLVK